MSNNGHEPLPPYPPAADEPQRSGPASGTVLAISLGILALLAGGFFGIRTATDDGGAGDPEAAVRDLIDAASDEDVLGVLAAIAPAERDGIQEAVEDAVDELKRLEVLSENASLEKVSGLELSFDEVALDSERLAGDVAVVRIEGGRVRSSVFPDQLPLGSFFDEIEEAIGTDPRDEEPTDETNPLVEGEPVRLVAVERDGGWYVSLWYTVAELARVETDAAVPDFGAGVTPAGGGSPEAAVEELFAAVADLDVERVIALAPPGEADALHDYAPLFLDDVEQELEDVDADIEISSIETSAETDGDRARVTVEELVASGTVEDVTFELEARDERFEVDAEWEGNAVHVESDGDCVTIAGEEEGEPFTDEVCADELAGGRVADILGDHRPGFVAVQVDGQWYLSPTRTVLGAVVDVLRSLEKGDLEELIAGG